MTMTLDPRYKLTVSKGAFLVAALMLSGCQTEPKSNAELLATHDYRYQHPIVISEAPETLDLPVGKNTRNLRSPVTDTITSFAMDSRRHGSGSVEILVPTGAANESAVHAVVRDVRGALSRGGVNGKNVTTRTYRSTDPSADAPIRLSYARMKATTGECGVWPKNIGGGIGENTNYHNFGCATQANLAAMVENPSDLITPRAMTPSEQNRRAVVIEKYRLGETTASTFTEGVGAEVSE
jgi:pilus assembly protein CpaD